MLFFLYGINLPLKGKLHSPIKLKMIPYYMLRSLTNSFISDLSIAFSSRFYSVIIVSRKSHWFIFSKHISVTKKLNDLGQYWKEKTMF